MNLRRRMSCLYLVLFLVFYSSPVIADTSVGGRIAADTTWTLANSPYIVTSTVQVYGTSDTPATLTIEPGVIVKFYAAAGLQIGYNTSLGSLISQGTATSHITFTRNGASGTWPGITFNDKTVDATAVIEYADIQYSLNNYIYTASPTIRNTTITGATGYGLYLSASNAVVENFAIANTGSYGMYLTNSPALISGGTVSNTNASGGGIYLNASNASITNVSVSNNGTYGIYLQASSPIISGGSLTNTHASGQGIYGSGSPVISDYSVSITNTPNKYGLNLYSGATSSLSVTNSTIGNGIYITNTGITPTITGNTFTNADSSPIHAGANMIGQIMNDNTVTGMTSAGKIEVVGEVINRDTRFRKFAAPYVFSGTTNVYKNASTAATLIVDPGTIMKFGSSARMNIGSGSNKGVLIAQGTAEDRIVFTSSQAVPAPGNWSGLWLNGQAAGSGVLEFVTVEYAGTGGYNSSANLTISSSAPVLRNCIIRNSAGSGIYLTGSGNWPVILDSEITGNKWGVYSTGSNPYITNTKIYGNTTYGVYNGSTTIDVDARDNWWGLASGPTHSSNPSGAGDRITDHVLYNPWLGQEPWTPLSITDAKAMPTSLNPEGDFTRFIATISATADWTITITDANLSTKKTFTGTGTSINQTWYGEDSEDVKVDDGVYYFRIDAVEPGTSNTASWPQGMLMVSRQIPIAIIDTPADNEQFVGGSVINITGTASDTSNFYRYTLEVGEGENPTTWPISKTYYTSITDGLLHSLSTTTCTNSVYTLKLTVTDTSSNVAVETVRVRLSWIQNVSATEGYISPNGDDVRETTQINATFTQEAAWVLTFRNELGLVVRTYTGTGSSMAQAWDAKDEEGQIVPDGAYTYTIEAMGGNKSGSVVVDTVSPTAQITAPAAQAVIAGSVLVSGTAADPYLDNYKVEYGPASGSGPWNLISTGTTTVSSGELTTWVTNDESNAILVQNDSYLLRLTVMDKAGNSSATSVPVSTDNLMLSDIGVSSNSLNTRNSETATLFFTLSSSATTTVKIIPESQGPTGSPVRQASQNCAAGACSFVWDGKDSTGKVVPDEAYIFVLEATDGSKTDNYNPPVPAGSGSVTCSGSSYNPMKNEPMTVSYSVSQPERVDISISWAFSPFKIVDALPYLPGNYTVEWNGRGPTGMFMAEGAQLTCAAPALLRENAIVTTGDTPAVTQLKLDPYQMTASYGQFTRLTYTLDREDAIVTITLTPPSGVPFSMILDENAQWTAVDPGDPTGKTLVVAEEGMYMVTVRAANPDTGTTATAIGNLQIFP